MALNIVDYPTIKAENPPPQGTSPSGSPIGNIACDYLSENSCVSDLREKFLGQSLVTGSRLEMRLRPYGVINPIFICSELRHLFYPVSKNVNRFRWTVSRY